MKFLTNLDLNKDELQNVRAQNLAIAPSSPGVGQYYFNTADKTLYCWTGTEWKDALSIYGLGGTYGITQICRSIFYGNVYNPVANLHGVHSICIKKAEERQRGK